MAELQTECKGGLEVIGDQDIALATAAILQASADMRRNSSIPHAIAPAQGSGCLPICNDFHLRLSGEQ